MFEAGGFMKNPGLVSGMKGWRKGIPINSGHKSMGKEKRVEDKR